MKKLIILLAGVSALCLAGCSTVSTTNATTGAVTNTTQIDWPVIDTGIQGITEAASVVVLNHNPGYAAYVAAVNTAIQTTFTGTPTAASIGAAITAAAPKLSSADVQALSTVVSQVAQLYLSYSGKTSILPTDTVVQGVINAITTGITAGVSLHNATVSTTTPAIPVTAAPTAN